MKDWKQTEGLDGVHQRWLRMGCVVSPELNPRSLVQMSLLFATSREYRHSHPCVVRAPAEGSPGLREHRQGAVTQPGGQPGLPERGDA